jgi:hypothetical protein
MNLCVPDARRSWSSAASRSIWLVFAVLSLLAIAAPAARADDISVWLDANQYEAGLYVVEGWVFCDDPAGVPVVISGVPGGNISGQTDDTGYFCCLVQLTQGSIVTATVTDSDESTATASVEVD